MAFTLTPRCWMADHGDRSRLEPTFPLVAGEARWKSGDDNEGDGERKEDSEIVVKVLLEVWQRRDLESFLLSRRAFIFRKAANFSKLDENGAADFVLFRLYIAPARCYHAVFFSWPLTWEERRRRLLYRKAWNLSRFRLKRRCKFWPGLLTNGAPTSVFFFLFFSFLVKIVYFFKISRNLLSFHKFHILNIFKWIKDKTSYENIKTFKIN